MYWSIKFFALGLILFVGQCVSANGKVEITLVLRGDTVKGEPRVGPASDSFAVLHDNVKQGIKPQKISDREWKCTLDNNGQYVIGWISKKMFGFISEPFIARDKTSITFSPGNPITFEYDLIEIPSDVDTFPATISLLKNYSDQGKITSLNWASSKIAKKPGTAEFKGLALGSYRLIAMKQDFRTWDNPVLYDIRDINITPSTYKFKPVFPVFHKNRDADDAKIQGRILGPGGFPLPKITVKLCAANVPPPEIYYPDVITDGNGFFSFDAVIPNKSVEIRCGETRRLVLKESLPERASATFNISMVKAATKANTSSHDFIFTWPDCKTSQLSEFQRKPVILYFWASWCSPCKRAMPTVNALALKYKDRAVFIAVCVDSDRNIWQTALSELDYSGLKQAWFDQALNNCYIYEVIPYVLIVDSSGRISYSGTKTNFEEELAKAL